MTKLLSDLWECYYAMNAQVPKIHAALQDHGEQEIINDHIAFRTFAGPKSGLDKIKKPFEDLGWQIAGNYFFKQKKLRAIHLERQGAPKIFLSELIVEDFSPEFQAIVSAELAQLTAKEFTAEMLVSGRWQKADPDLETYNALLSESEYAAWLYIFGICPNHFTVYVNALETFSDIDVLNTFLLVHGYVMNTAGGIVKGTMEDGLRQSSTMAATVPVKFSNLEVLDIPCCYYEFAQRYLISDKMFQGFVTASADKIFQSTDSK